MSTTVDTLITEKADSAVHTALEKEKKGVVDSAVKLARDTVQQEFGDLPKRYVINVNDIPMAAIEGVTHHDFEKVLHFVTAAIPVLLVGPAGSGKNVTLKQVAEALGVEFYFTNAVTQEYKLTGFIDAYGNFQETQFYQAFKNGGLFFLDEMDASVPDALIILNAAIANGYFDFPCGRVEANENFRVVAAANTFGTGADNVYIGRNQLDAATLDRFAVLKFDYDAAIEEQLAKSKAIYHFVANVRQTLENLRMRSVVSMRATEYLSKMDGVIEPEELITDVVFKGMSDDDLVQVQAKMPKLTRNKYYDALTKKVETIQIK